MRTEHRIMSLHFPDKETEAHKGTGTCSGVTKEEPPLPARGPVPTVFAPAPAPPLTRVMSSVLPLGVHTPSRPNQGEGESDSRDQAKRLLPHPASEVASPGWAWAKALSPQSPWDIALHKTLPSSAQEGGLPSTISADRVGIDQSPGW